MRFAGSVFNQNALDPGNPGDIAQLTPSMMDELVRDEDEQELLDLGGIIPRSLDYDMGIIKTRPGTPQYYYERARPGGPF